MTEARDEMGMDCLEVILKGNYVQMVEGRDGKRD